MCRLHGIDASIPPPPLLASPRPSYPIEHLSDRAPCVQRPPWRDGRGPAPSHLLLRLLTTRARARVYIPLVSAFWSAAGRGTHAANQRPVLLEAGIGGVGRRRRAAGSIQHGGRRRERRWQQKQGRHCRWHQSYHTTACLIRRLRLRLLLPTVVVSINTWSSYTLFLFRYNLLGPADYFKRSSPTFFCLYPPGPCATHIPRLPPPPLCATRGLLPLLPT